MALDPQAQLEIAGSLDPGESLLWTGRPARGVLLRPVDAFLIPFSVLWCGFAVFWETMAVRGRVVPFALVGAPFVAIGLYVLIGRFFADARRRARTFYGLTDRRVILVSGLFSRQVDSLPLRTLSGVSVHLRKDGSGSLSFGPPHPFGSWYAAMPWPGTAGYQTPGFERIPDAKRVHDQVLEAQRAAR
jgi:hypothetical protein